MKGYLSVAVVSFVAGVVAEHYAENRGDSDAPE